MQQWLRLGGYVGGFPYGYNAHKFSMNKLLLQDLMIVNPKNKLFSYIPDLQASEYRDELIQSCF